MKHQHSTAPVRGPRMAHWIAPALAAFTLGMLGVGSAAHADTQTRTSSFEYTPQGQLQTQTLEPSRPNDCLQSAYTYTGYGDQATTSASACAGATGATLLSAGAARTSTDSYDYNFILNSVRHTKVVSTNALGQSETKVLEPRFGKLVSLTGPNGLTTTWAYDNFGRKTQETRSDGTSTRWTYQRCTDSGASCPGAIGGASSQWVLIEQSMRAGANGATTTTPSAPEKRQYLDAFNRVLRLQTQGFDGGGGGGVAPKLVQDTEYDALGRVARQSSLYALDSGAPVWASFTYDALGRLATESHPDTVGSAAFATTRTTYSALVTTVTNANNQSKTTTKNAQGLVASVTDAQGNSIVYGYDAAGSLTSTNAAGSLTTLAYDQRGRKTAMLDPAMGSWIYGYNAFGELVSQRDSLNQTTTLAYDALGRMLQRLEPDLNSQWSYDQKFDGTPCGKGVGKLCEAKADSGYNRQHHYDDQGRLDSTATVLDSASAPATVSQAFDPFTGQVFSKTWPTTYQAFYSYSDLGYLKSVTGGGSNGFAQNASYQVLAMDAAGHVTQYKLGGKVTTVKTFDANTQRLSAQTATTDGQISGNVLAQSYGYDPLGNLTSRSDTTPSVNTSENFSYDSLNRLTLATTLGGAVNGSNTTEVMYDPRGNITYKSDVGRYWYDTARPNRMTNVTLESAPGSSIPFSANRTLSYAFDDYSAGAQTVNGTTVGNGNLSYTVSHDKADTANARHTVRFESYTSFNMPKEMRYSNFAANTTTCPDGYTLSNSICSRTSSTSNPAGPLYSCPSGQALSGSTCTLITNSGATPNYACAAGYSLSGTNCVKTTTYAATPTWGCPAGSWGPYSGTCIYNEYSSVPQIAVAYSCPSGGTLSGSTCSVTSTIAASIASYSCPAGQVLSGSTCTLTTTSTATPSGWGCATGQLNGNSCVVTQTLSVPPGTSNASDRTLIYIYGPEHQRTREVVTLSGNGTSSYFAGNTWFLNGEDGLGLSYEKEARSNGTTEYRHYLTAAGQAFALFTSRTGTLNGLPATTTSYFQHDHLGSIVAITDENGAVSERLAYDPWGKRRFINSAPGTTDNLDTLVGQNTDRGYTEQEHLDEIGVIHMNGRVYDPLVGRFMSADTIIPNPYDLRAFNRYAYVYNNPLKFFDPTGHHPDDGEGENHTAHLREITVTASREYGFDGDGNRRNSEGARNTVTVMVPTPVPAVVSGVPVPLIQLVPVALPVPPVPRWIGKLLGYLNAWPGFVTKNGFWGISKGVFNALSVDNAAGADEARAAVRDKIPAKWGDGEENRKEGTGHRWSDPDNPKGTGVRVDVGDPNNSNPSQQVDHVVVRDNGVVIGRDGQPINGSIKQDPENAHIPLSEYQNWQSWNKP